MQAYSLILEKNFPRLFIMQRRLDDVGGVVRICWIELFHSRFHAALDRGPTVEDYTWMGCDVRTSDIRFRRDLMMGNALVTISLVCAIIL